MLARVIFLFIVIIMIASTCASSSPAPAASSARCSFPRLLSDGHAVRALGATRPRVSRGRIGASRALRGAAPSAEILHGDALTGEGLARALDGVEVAYYLIHSMEATPRAPSVAWRVTFAERERVAAENFAAAAARARRAPDRLSRRAAAGRPAAPASRHLASREAVERILLDAVPDSVALRASIVIGARSRSFRFLVRLVERLPVLTLPAWRRFALSRSTSATSSRCSPRPRAAPTAAGRSLDVGGPDMLTYGEMIARIAELMLVQPPRARLRCERDTRSRRAWRPRSPRRTPSWCCR